MKYAIMPMNRVLERKIIDVKDRAEAIKWARARFGSQKVSVIKL